jgi:aspartyl-tRNA synthetase
MLLTNNDSIKEVILFPSMKKLKEGEGEESEEKQGTGN